ncbi:MAG TPA: hypothetical protein DCL53_06875 [Thauera sp.]|nr:hypothetical protein [Thauera sp.]
MIQDATDLASVLADALQALDGLTVDEAHKRAYAILTKAAELGHGGTTYHLHTLDYLTRDQIAARVRAEYNGRNVQMLARRYGKSRSTIYRILKRGTT